MAEPTDEQTARAREFWHTRPNVQAMAQLIADVYDEGMQAATKASQRLFRDGYLRGVSDCLEIIEGYADIWTSEEMLAEIRALSKQEGF